MKKTFLLLTAISLALFSFVSCKDDKNTDEPESSTVLCPFADGNKWTYIVESKLSNSSLPEVSYLTEGLVFQVKSFTLDGKTGYSYEPIQPTDKNFSLMNTDKKGNIVELQFKDGKYIGESIIYKKDAKAGEKYKAQMFVEDEDGGEMYDMDMACVKRDTTLKVPAGNFNCICFCMTVYDNNVISDKFYSFYSENVGLIQDVRYEFLDKEGKDSVMMNRRTLKSYELK